MKDANAFKAWLEINTTYTRQTRSNIVSRINRADMIMPVIADPIYIYNLSLNTDFKKLTVSVKSQIRRAIRIYIEFKESTGTDENDKA